MTDEAPRPRRSRADLSRLSGPHRRLVIALTDARLRAGLTGAQLGTVHGWGQGKISKIESGRTRPSVEDVKAWLTTTSPDLDEAGRAELLELADQVSGSAMRFTDIDHDGIAAQQQARAALEAEATSIKIYQPKVIPGLAQTPEYTRNLLLKLGRDPAQIHAAVAARAERQRVLYDSRVTIEMVIQESVLRRRFGSPAVNIAQLAFLRGIAQLPNIYLGIVTDKTNETLLPETSFVLKAGADYADVQVELLTRELTVSEADEIAAYEKSFARQKDAAVDGVEADAVIQRAVDYLGTIAA